MKVSMFTAAGLLALATPAAPSHAQTGDADEAPVDLADALNCRLAVPQYNGFALSISGEDGIAAQRQWRSIKSGNPFMNEYELPEPVVVAGHETRRLGFTASAIVALIDLPDPTDLARSEGIENAMDAGPLLAEMLAAENANEAPSKVGPAFRKFLGERVIADVQEKPTGTEEWGTHATIARTISTVSTHPGKTLYGCSYRMEITDKDGKAL